MAWRVQNTNAFRVLAINIKIEMDAESLAGRKQTNEMMCIEKYEQKNKHSIYEEKLCVSNVCAHWGEYMM